MKHLFIINSHTTYLTSIGVVNYKSLNEREVCFVYIRYYSNGVFNVPYKTIDLSAYYNILSKNKFVSIANVIKAIDDNIFSLVEGNEYIMYAPHPGGTKFFQVILSNKLCVGFNYVQEGALVFEKIFSKSRLPVQYDIYDKLIKILFKHRVWATYNDWSLPPFLDNLQYKPECFTISKGFFKHLDCPEHIVKWPKYEIEGSAFEITPSFPCFIFESSVEMGVVEKDIYFKYVKELISEKSSDVNYVKFHPSQSKENQKEILDLFSKYHKEVKELRKDFPFELYLSSYSNMNIIGFNSSLIVFAKEMGHNTFSLEQKLLDDSEKYRTFRKKL